MLTTKSEAATPYDSLTFNGEYYLNEYPDVKNAVGSGNYWGAYSHFVNYGINEGRRGSPYFDVRYYLNKYSDLQRAFGANYAGAYNHFVNCGINENRSGSPYIDPEYYASKYSDIRNAFGSDYSGIYNHFYTNGIKEGRRGSKYFDVGYYLNTNQDLLKTFGRENYAAAFNHFLTCGINELRDPSSDINIDCYLNSYTDLQKAFGNNKNYRGLFEHCYTNSEADKRTTNHKIVDITIKTEPTCTERGQVGGTQCERCGKIIVSPIYKPALGHDWDEPVFNWEGTDKCTVKFTCKRANHPQTLDAVITSEEKDGTVVYTATVTVDGETYTNVKNDSAVPGPGTGGTPSGGGGGSTGGGGTGGGTVTPPTPPTPQHTHTYGDPTWSWSNNNQTATATFTCTNNDDTKTENASVSSNITKSATCTENGTTTYTATVNFNGKSYSDTKTNDKLPVATGHQLSSSFTKDTKDGFVKECTVCHKEDVEKPTQLTTTFTVNNYTGDDFSDKQYSKGETETWSLEKEITASETKGSLKNKVKEQTCSDGIGYYITITVKPLKNPTVPSTINITSEVKISEDNQNVKEVARKVNSDGSVELLLRLEKLNCLSNCGGSSCSCANGKSENCKCNKVITITIDCDGSELGGYQPQTCTIDYCQLEFKKDFTVTFEYRDEINKEIKVEEGTKVTNEMLQTVDLQNTENIGNEFHDFQYWCKQSGNSYEKFELESTDIEEDITLVPFFNLDVDKFVTAVVEDLNDSDSIYSQDFSEQFNMTKNSNDITISINEPNIPVATLADTSIPGTIAYVLQKNEIKDITLTFENGSKKFENSSTLIALADNPLKDKVIEDAKSLFNAELNQKEPSTTLDKLENSNKSFKLKIGDSNDTNIKLVSNGKDLSDENNTYTFSFDSDFVVVDADDDTELGIKTIKEALQTEKNIIYIDGNLKENDTLTIQANKDIIIKGIQNTNSTISLEEQKDYVIDVKSGTGNVTISDIKVTGGKKAQLKIENGAKVIIDNLDVDVSGMQLETVQKEKKDFQAAIIVNGELTVSGEIKNKGEKYDFPTIRIPREDSKAELVGNVTLDNKTLFTSDNYIGIIKNQNSRDVDVRTSDKCYYINSDNTKIYCITFQDQIEREINGSPFSLVKWYHNGEHISQDEIENFRKNWEKTNEEKIKQSETAKNLMFDGWYDSNGKKVENFNNEVLNENKLYVAKYKTSAQGPN